ncbi:MAG: SPOR domain-containing protein [Magnetococcales bacterium]|nr:SPOR domain-containing protein [Magnetococcales bacterium]
MSSNQVNKVIVSMKRLFKYMPNRRLILMAAMSTGLLVASCASEPNKTQDVQAITVPTVIPSIASTGDAEDAVPRLLPVEGTRVWIMPFQGGHLFSEPAAVEQQIHQTLLNQTMALGRSEMLSIGPLSAETEATNLPDPRSEKGAHILHKMGVSYVLTGAVEIGETGYLTLEVYRPPEPQMTWITHFAMTSKEGLADAVNRAVGKVINHLWRSHERLHMGFARGEMPEIDQPLPIAEPAQTKRTTEVHNSTQTPPQAYHATPPNTPTTATAKTTLTPALQMLATIPLPSIPPLSRKGRFNGPVIKTPTVSQKAVVAIKPPEVPPKRYQRPARPIAQQAQTARAQTTQAPTKRAKNINHNDPRKGPTSYFDVAVESCQNMEYAQEKVTELKKRGYRPYIVDVTMPDGRRFHSVRISRHDNREQAESIRVQFMNRERMSAFLVALPQRKSVQKAYPVPRVAPRRIEPMQPSVQSQPTFRAAVPLSSVIPPMETEYEVQVGAHLDPKNAEKTLSMLKRRGYDPYIFGRLDTKNRMWWLVRLGPFSSKDSAVNAMHSFMNRNRMSATVAPVGGF